MWKDKDSYTGDCPAQYKAPGGYVIQGKKIDQIDPAIRAQLRDLGADEDAVWVPNNVIERNRDL